MQPFQSWLGNNPTVANYSETCPLTEAEWKSHQYGLCEINDNLTNHGKKLDGVINTIVDHTMNLTNISNTQHDQENILDQIETTLVTYDKRLNNIDESLTTHTEQLKEQTQVLHDNSDELEKVNEDQTIQVSLTQRIFSWLSALWRLNGTLRSVQHEQGDKIRSIKDKVDVLNDSILVIEEKLNTQTMYINTLMQNMENQTKDIQAIQSLLHGIDSKINKLTVEVGRCSTKQNKGNILVCCNAMCLCLFH